MIIQRQVIVKYYLYTHKTWVMNILNHFSKIFLVLSPFLLDTDPFSFCLDPDPFRIFSHPGSGSVWKLYRFRYTASEYTSFTIHPFLHPHLSTSKTSSWKQKVGNSAIFWVLNFPQKNCSSAIWHLAVFKTMPFLKT